MFRPFRTLHAAKALDAFLKQSRPLDQFLNAYFRANHSIGSKDRKEIGDLLFDWMKWKSLFEFSFPLEMSAEEKIDAYLSFDPYLSVDDPSIPGYIRACLPKTLFDSLAQQYGEEEVFKLGKVFNERAPLTVRVNTKRISRDVLLQRFSSKYRVRPSPQSPCGIVFEEKVNIQGLEEWKEGLIELQDEASQLVALLVKPKKGERVLDYCAGGGGKSLAIAANSPPIALYLHDVRSWALTEAKKRFIRGKLPAFSLFSFNEKPHSFDWILLDVPCSGSGTYRRNPDLKWKFSATFLDELITLQKSICKEALKFLKPGGSLVYATCSILREENDDQTEWLVQNENCEVISPPFRSLPRTGGMDGFFGCVLKKKSL